MGYIYKVTCKITKKNYIGKTETSITQRQRDHYRAAFLPSHGDYDFPFHRAIRKYGINNFIIKKIDESNDAEELKAKEIFQINFYDSYNNGYNATKGGDGHCKYNYDDIVNFYLSNDFSLIKTCLYFKINDQIVYSALKSKNIDYKNLFSSQKKRQFKNKILLVEKNIIFNSMKEIDDYFHKQVHGNIRRCLNGLTEKAYGYHWKEVKD